MFLFRTKIFPQTYPVLSHVRHVWDYTHRPDCRPHCTYTPRIVQACCPEGGRLMLSVWLTFLSPVESESELRGMNEAEW